MLAVEIMSQRTVIRLFSEADAPEIFPHIAPITRFMAWQPPESLEAFSAIWNTWIPAMRNGTDLHFVVRAQDDGRFLGLVGLHDLRSRHPELGIWLRRDAHGQGLGREVIGAVTTWAARNMTVDYFLYPVAAENMASRRIAEFYGGAVRGERPNAKFMAVLYHIPPMTDTPAFRIC